MLMDLLGGPIRRTQRRRIRVLSLLSPERINVISLPNSNGNNASNGMISIATTLTLNMRLLFALSLVGLFTAVALSRVPIMTWLIFAGAERSFCCFCRKWLVTRDMFVTRQWWHPLKQEKNTNEPWKNFKSNMRLSITSWKLLYVWSTSGDIHWASSMLIFALALSLFSSPLIMEEKCMMLRVTRIPSFLSVTLSKIGMCPLLAAVGFVDAQFACNDGCIFFSTSVSMLHPHVHCQQEHPCAKVLDGSL